jgi:hypothetical protein
MVLQEKFVMKEIRTTSMSTKERNEAENEVKVLRSLRVSDNRRDRGTASSSTNPRAAFQRRLLR